MIAKTKHRLPTSSNPQQPVRSSAAADHLDSWKEIANYLKREVRTVQLWEKKEGMPVHRHFHQQLGSVFAFRSEIDKWKQKLSRTSGGNYETNAEEIPTHSRAHVRIQVTRFEDTPLSKNRRNFCETIMEDTIAALEQLSPERLSIVPVELFQQQQRTSPATVSGGPSNDYLLQWRVQEDDGGLLVSATLLFADTEGVVWSHTYQCDPDNPDETPTYLADQIVQCIWLKAFSFPVPPTTMGWHEKSCSREMYLKGRYFWNQRNEEGFRRAIHYFESAIQEDPTFAPPYSGLADSLTLLSFYEIVHPSEAMPSARQAALKAIELDPNLAEAHASLADILLQFDRDWEGADHEYRRAIHCNPGYATGYHWYANLLIAKGQHEAAHIAIMHALKIDPVSPITLVWAGVTAYMAHRFDEAIQHHQNALELDPGFIWAHMYMAQALEQKSNFEEALQEFETAIQLAGGSNCVKAMKAHTHAIAGDKSSARRILQELTTTPTHQFMPSYDIAATYAALGESGQVALWLKRACNERNMRLFSLVQDPRFDPSRHHSEFKNIVEQMGLTQYGYSPVLSLS